MPAEKLGSVVYVRLAETNYKYLRTIHERTGVPISRIVDSLIGHARANDWRVETQITRVVEDESQADGITQSEALWEEHLRDEP